DGVQQEVSHLDLAAGRSVFETTDSGEYAVHLMQVDPVPGVEWVTVEAETVRGGVVDHRIVAAPLDSWRGEVVVRPTDLETQAPLSPVLPRLHGVPLLEDGRPHRRIARKGVVLDERAARVENLPPGEYVLELRFADGRPPAFEAFEIRRGEPRREIRAEVGRGARVVLVVDGLPSGATPEVEVRRVPLREWERIDPVAGTVEAVPGAPGRFAVRGLWAGSVVLDVRAGDASAQERIDLPASGVHVATIGLSP
ncbi:MAG: hypothetical protein ACF8XB_11130, partial [Planctomycetota bacterium JB042]